MTIAVWTNARLVLPGEIVTGSLSVEGGRIADLDTGPSRVPDAIDCEGQLLMPGLVELHTDHFEKHLVPRQDVEWPAFPALLAHDAQIATAGITTVFDALTIGMIDERPERGRMLGGVLDALETARAARALRAEHFLHLRCEVASPGLIALFETMRDRPALGLLSLMDHSPGDRQYKDMKAFKKAFEDSLDRDPGRADAQIEALLATRDKVAGPARRAIASVARDKRIPLASHDDSSVAHIDEAVALGCSMSEFPTTLEAAGAAKAKGLFVLAGAPNVIRGGSHTGNVAAEDLLTAGVLDALSSDYMPVSLLAAPFRLAERTGRPLEEMLRLVTSGPAKIVGLGDRGELVPGKRADVLQVEPSIEGPLVRGVWAEGRRVA